MGIASDSNERVSQNPSWAPQWCRWMLLTLKSLTAMSALNLHRGTTSTERRWAALGRGLDSLRVPVSRDRASKRQSSGYTYMIVLSE